MHWKKIKNKKNTGSTHYLTFFLYGYQWPGNGLAPTADDESQQREECAVKARTALEPQLANRPRHVKLRRNRHQQQWHRDRAPSPEALATTSSAAPWSLLQRHGRQALGMQRARLSDALADARRLFSSDGAAEFWRQTGTAAAVAILPGGGSGARNVPPVPRFGRVGGR